MTAEHSTWLAEEDDGTVTAMRPGGMDRCWLSCAN